MVFSPKPCSAASEQNRIVYVLRNALLALFLIGAQTSPQGPDQPAVLPTRDVDITYRITRPQQPALTERRRWLASEHLQRVDVNGGTTIFDHKRGEFTLLNPSTHTYRKFEGTPRMPRAPGKDVALKRGSDAVIAGLHCTDWSWIDHGDDETPTACLTADGVMLRLVIGGTTIMQARSVTYAKQPPEVFQVPSGYLPGLAPEGGFSPD
jgi:hypothetical protein